MNSLAVSREWDRSPDSGCARLRRIRVIRCVSKCVELILMGYYCGRLLTLGPSYAACFSSQFAAHRSQLMARATSRGGPPVWA